MLSENCWIFVLFFLGTSNKLYTSYKVLRIQQWAFIYQPNISNWCLRRNHILNFLRTNIQTVLLNGSFLCWFSGNNKDKLNFHKFGKLETMSGVDSVQQSIQFPVFFIRCHSVNVDRMPKFAVFLLIDQRQCAHSTSFIWCFNAIFRYYQSHRRNNLQSI